MCDNSKECLSAKATAFGGAGANRRPLEDSPHAQPTGPAPSSVRPGWADKTNERLVVAVPSELEGGLDAERSMHFGKAPGFAIVVLDGGYIAKETFLTNMPHAEAGHGAAAQTLVDLGVTDVITVGIGTGMYRRLAAAGVRVWRELDAPTVSSAIDAFVAGEAEPFPEQDIHAGGHG